MGSRAKSTQTESLDNLNSAPDAIKLAVSFFQDKWKYAVDDVCKVAEINHLFHGTTSIDQDFLTAVSNADKFKLSLLKEGEYALTIYANQQPFATVFIDRVSTAGSQGPVWAVGDIYLTNQLGNRIRSNGALGEKVYQEIRSIFINMKIHESRFSLENMLVKGELLEDRRHSQELLEDRAHIDSLPVWKL